MNYKEQIKSPKWQKRRLEILQRDDFKCQICGDSENTLNVHHLVYHKDRNIWEYEDWELITLCEECHEHEHIIEESINERIWSLKSRGLSAEEICALLEKIDIELYMGNDFCITNIVGDEWIPEIESGYLKKIVERRHKLKEK
ncbi:HNH endonuclease [Phocaeicola massiliensis]|uniref:HNH endonuclease n=1 Tax=Phocaeicola massiliensis TaxID=204516 RepID=UPI0032ECA951